jgi:oxazoline/thiazoline synthase
VSVLCPSSSADDGLIHTYVAGHNFGCPSGGLRALRHALRSKSAGKGKSDAQAKASGLCEALERYSGLYQGDEPTLRASFHQLGKAALHPNACLLFSDAQYRERDAWNAAPSRFHWVPVPFDEAWEIDWTPVASLTQNETAYLPTAFCYYRYPLPPEQRFCHADSNGNAAGNTLEEAILQGFLELVERDSVALWWYNRLPRPGVDLESFDDPYLLALRQHYRDRGRDLWALDLTSDLGIPAFAALSRRANSLPEGILMGFGAHLDPGVALLRAVTEMNQMLVNVERPAFSNGAGEEDTEYEQDVARWLREATLESEPYLAPDPRAAPRTRADFPRRESDDLREDVLTCVEIARQHRMETFVLDQTRPDIELRVVKVIVPGLRHFWRRLAPGRLYDVPVALGWLPAPLAEEQLNPISVII